MMANVYVVQIVLMNPSSHNSSLYFIKSLK